MTVKISETLETALKMQADAHGISPEIYLYKLLERELIDEPNPPVKPFESGRGSFAKYGQAPSAEEIDANRADMFRNFGENF